MASRGDHQLSTVDAVTQFSFTVYSLLEHRAEKHDLSMVLTRLLGILRDRRPTMNELAQLMDLDKSSMSGLVDRAHRRGLVVRCPSEHDRRVVLVELTSAGRLVVEQLARQFETDVATLLSTLSAHERKQLSQLATVVVSAQASLRGIELFDGKS